MPPRGLENSGRWLIFPDRSHITIDLRQYLFQKGLLMDKNNETNSNWQSVLEEFGDTDNTTPNEQPTAEQAATEQPEQPQFAQPEQPQFTQPQQPQFTQPQQPQFTQPQQPQFTQPQQPQFTQPQQPQFTQQPQGQFNQPQQAAPMFNAQDNQNQNFGQPYYDAANFSVVPAKRKSKVLPIVLIVLAAAIIVGGLVFTYFAFFSGGKSNYESVERGYFSNIEHSVNEAFPNVNGKAGVESTMTITPGQAITDMLMSESGGAGADYNLLPTVIKSTAFEDGTSGKVQSITKLISCGKYEVLTVNMWVDNGAIYIQIPELLSKYILLDIEKLSSSSGDYSDFDITDVEANTVSMALTDTLPASAVPMMMDNSTYEMLDFVGNIASNFTMPEDAVLDKIIDLFTDTYFKHYGDSPKTSGNSLTIGGTTDEFDAYLVNFTAESVLNFAIDLLTGCQNDADILAYLTSIGIDNASLNAAKSYLETNLQDLSEDDKQLSAITMTVYVNKKGEIVGRVIQAEDTKIVMGCIEKDGKFDAEFSIFSDGEKDGFTASGTVDGDKYAGTITFIESNENSFSCDFTFEGTDDKMNGSLSANLPSSDNGESVAFNVTFDINGSDANIVMDLLSNSQSMVKVEFAMKEVPYEEITFTAPDASNVIDMSQNTPDDVTNEMMANLGKVGETMMKNSESGDVDLLSMVFMLLFAGASAA